MIRVDGRFLGPLLLCVAGCGGPYSLSGTVTYDGQPLPRGEIVLTPDPDKGNSGPGLLLLVEDGRYSTVGNRGQVGGAYIARISGFNAPGEGGFSRFGYPLFVDYVIHLELPRHSATFDFDIPRQEPFKNRLPAVASPQSKPEP